MKEKSKHRAFYILALILLVGVLLFSGVQALKIYIPQRRDQNSFSVLKELITPAQNADGGTENRYAALTERNADFKAWLTINGTEIDYPVMQSETDPEFYLRRDFDKNYSRSGCLFIGEGCDIDSDSFIIYGHNMSIDTMFGTLDRYAEADFALNHRDIILSTPEGDRTYRVFAVFRTTISDDPSVFPYYDAVGNLGEADYTEAAERFRAMSEVDFADAPAYLAQLMILSTCSYHTSNGRFVVISYRTA